MREKKTFNGIFDDPQISFFSFHSLLPFVMIKILMPKIRWICCVVSNVCKLIIYIIASSPNMYTTWFRGLKTLKIYIQSSTVSFPWKIAANNPFSLMMIFMSFVPHSNWVVVVVIRNSNLLCHKLSWRVFLSFFMPFETKFHVCTRWFI